ncbi:unnamed protein product, partial [Polarella glacialis]
MGTAVDADVLVIACDRELAKEESVAHVEQEASPEARQLLEEGYIVLKGVLSAAECDALKEHVLLCTDEALRQGRNDLFGNIQEADSRSDMKLDLCEPVVQALNKFVDRSGGLFLEVMGGGVRVVELAAITSSNGAVAQPVHADTMHGVTRFLQSDIQIPDR